jgi:hypothetical protein
MKVMEVFEASFRARIEVDKTNLGTASLLWVIDFSLSVRHNFHLMRSQLSPYGCNHTAPAKASKGRYEHPLVEPQLMQR